MFMVHFMCPSQAFCESVIRISENFEALVNKNIMNREISNSIGKNSKPNRQSDPNTIISPQQEESNTDNGVKNKKQVIALPPTVVVFLVVIPMKFP